ncbi:MULTISPECIES: LacI family DNA-binding transcriptional regulator [unclassified Rhizobium]|mgnify:FL=1|jgi:LacI family transcriptional regulator|uniref:LacI family DNA-binding transcriptional regulator n=1 Tax=unclassified Rhizobium TaxID=2613769 RepID=UPI000647D4D0|nr:MULTISPECIES: LacI family DNA-binding transcriptional regulator [unclassified Rhizobium]MBN8954240.1 LacI family DNA-binding transcriptional regulator [Rhizobium tropici]OJY70870.1 MAG: transcriptional regulator [Rhizobium sp. 60-20]RKD50774.1 LacI family transcriptional regulator [Rhizobium sp. WW_1]
MANERISGLKDVAKAAGVSVATVSRMLNGSLDLPAATKQRIDEAIASLKYQPNPHARRLSRGRSDTIGLVVPDIANPFFATMVAAIEEEANDRGLAVSLYATLNRTGREVAYLRLIEHNHVDGLVFVTNHPDDGELAELINRTGKVIVVDEDVPLAVVPKLFCDNFQGGQLAGRHLAEFGHRQVLYVGGPDAMISTQRRFNGLCKGLRERFGDAASIRRYSGEYTIACGREMARRFLDEGMPATAIFASSDEIAIGMIEVLRERGISIPEDLSLIGFDDVSPLHLFAPPVTAIRQPVRTIGQRALALLLETNWQESKSLATEELVPVEIVVRKSVAPPSTHNKQR